MICQECKAAGQKSTVTPLGGSTTAMYCAPYYDEDGKYHHHDANVVTESFSCSNGHKWVSQKYNKCPGCDWPNDVIGSEKKEEEIKSA
jgi:hypothetical protein